MKQFQTANRLIDEAIPVQRRRMLDEWLLDLHRRNGVIDEVRIPQNIKDWKLFSDNDKISLSAHAANDLRREAYVFVANLYERIVVMPEKGYEDSLVMLTPIIKEARQRVSKVMERHIQAGATDTEPRSVWRWFVTDAVMEALAVDRKTIGGDRLEKVILQMVSGS